MAFDLRCPDCDAKLRLDERPDPDAAVDCPECGATFPARNGMAKGEEASKKKKSKPKSEKAGGAKKPNAPMEAQERTFMNPFLLLVPLLAGFGLYILVAVLILNTLSRAGKVIDMTAYVPAECNVVRGSNLAILGRYPGYKDELKQYTPPPVAAGLDALAEAAGHEKKVMQDYMIVGTVVERAASVYVIRAAEVVDRELLKTGLKATEKTFAQVVTQVDAKAVGAVPVVSCLQLPPTAPGILANALLYQPTDRYLIVAPPSPLQSRLLLMSAVGGIEPEKGLFGELGDTHKLIIRGHGWVMIKAVGGMEPYPKSLGAAISRDVAPAAGVLKTTKIIGAWNSFGASVRYGGAVDCGTPEAAAEVVKGLKKSPLGKGDEAEMSREIQAIYSPGYDKKQMSEMLLNLDFKKSGTAAYFTSKLSGENAKGVLQSKSIAAFGNVWS
ncbi:MAG: hypothetical protein ACRC7O_01180, partial [Fimbriiglobus sp.]